MSADMTNPWITVTADSLGEIPVITGVFEIRRGVEVLDIDYAGALEPFGLRSKISRVVDELGVEGLEFRHEVHVQYRTRFEELVLVHQARNAGHLPARLVGRDIHVPGRLSPG